ncbi:MAG TPA: GTPase ObgE [Actinomycetota bacterium]
MERSFVDEVKVHVAAGDGGDGAASFHREKGKPKGRADGGNGGDGGSVIFRVDPNVATLSDLARNPHQRAVRGRNGQGNERHGSGGEDRIVLIPDGTVVFDGESGELLADLVGAGTTFVAAAGGRGGRGNAALLTARRRAPGFAERGEPGEQRRLRLELKVLADVGLVGFPNAGKSSLIARLSAARPKVAAYPFTTLSPNLGVTETADARFVVADVPGLIEGASEGRGLGLAFLRHLERCRALCFVLDVSSEVTPGDALVALRAELRAHDTSFDGRPGVVAANKTDVAETEDAITGARAAADEAGFAFVACSALTGDGVGELTQLLAREVERTRAEGAPSSHKLIRIRPEDDRVTVEREDAAWRIRNPAAERLVRRFDLDNIEALRYVQDRMVSIGVESALSKAGAKEGDEVRIGDIVFDFEPEDGTGGR